MAGDSSKKADRKTNVAAKSRKKKPAVYKSFRLGKRITSDVTVPSARVLLGRSLQLLRAEWKLFGGLSVLFFFCQLVFVKGIGVTDSFGAIKEVMPDIIGTSSSIVVNIASLTYLLSSSGASDQATGLYQSIFVLLFSLATIWALRQVYGATKPHQVSVRDALYKGMTPLVPTLAVLVVMTLQLIPTMIILSLFTIVRANGLAVTGVEQLAWVLLLGGIILLSFYMITSSTIALYIVTLPDMTPIKALRSARRLVFAKRSVIVRRIITLPILLLLIGIVLMVPLILWLDMLIAPLLLFGGPAVLCVFHAYMYQLYRSLMP